MTQDQPNRLDGIEATQAVHSQILNELALAHRELASFSTRQASRQQQTSDRHDDELMQLRQQAEQQRQRTDRALEALSQTQVECLQLIAQNTVAIARTDQRIQEILERLDRRFGNGNGRGEG